MESDKKWFVEWRKHHMNTLKLLAVKNGTLRIAKVRYKNAIHIKSNNPTTISYLLKMEEGGRAQEARLKK